MEFKTHNRNAKNYKWNVILKFTVTSDFKNLKLVSSTEAELEQLLVYFKRKAKGYRYHPLFKRGIWDGSITFFDDRKHRLSIGLWKELYNMCKKYDFDLVVTGLSDYLGLKDFDPSEYIEWETEFYKDSEMKLRYYQTDTVVNFLKWKRSIAELATSAGKTLILFNLFAFLKAKGYLKGQFLVIVPNISLVLQTYEAFLKYSNYKKKLDFSIQTIGGGENVIDYNSDVIIGTFQTLRTFDNSILSRVSVVCADECHGVDTVSVKDILSKCDNAVIRCGLSGTTLIEKNDAASFTLQAYLGPLIISVKPKELIANNFASDVKIVQIYLKYLDEDIKEQLMELTFDKKVDNGKVLRYEKKIVTTNALRKQFIINLVKSFDKNAMVLFQDVVGRYGKEIYEQLKQELPTDKYEILYVSGEVSKELREEYRLRLNQRDKIRIIIASFGVFSTGIDVNNLHYILLAESYKSEKIIKQGIGRGMRLDENKDDVTIYDLIDDFRIKGFSKYKNFIFKHSEQRLAIYRQEEFEVTKKVFDLAKEDIEAAHKKKRLL